MPITVCLHIRSAHSILLVWERRKRAAYANRTILWMMATISWRLFEHFPTQKHAASLDLRQADMNVSTSLRDAYALCNSSILWRACFRVLKAGWITVVPDPTNEHCGHRCDRFRYVHFLIQGRKHGNSDTETSHACVSYMRINLVLLLWKSSLNDHSKLKGQCSDVKNGGKRRERGIN